MLGDLATLGGFAAIPLALGLGIRLVLRGPADRPVGGARLVAGNVLVLLFLLSLAWLGLEAYYRLVYDETDTANRSRLSARWFDRYWQLNSYGVRDDVDYAVRIAPGHRRVTFLGDSYTTGHGVKDVRDRFANRIRDARPDWEVHSVAVNGMHTLDELATLQRFVAKGYELDAVVLVYVYNDIDTFVPELHEFPQRLPDPPRWLAPFLEASFAADLYFHRWVQRQAASGASVPYPRLRSEAYDGPAWERTAALLRRLQALVRSRGGRFGAVTFPWMQMLVAGETELPLYAKLEDFWREQGVPHLGLLPVLEPHVSEGLLVNRRDPHPNERAHALVAEALLPFLEEEVLPRPGARREPPDA